jgi:hypothetical protein
MPQLATTQTIRHNSFYKVSVNTVTGTKVVIHLEVPTGILELNYQIYFNLIYQITRCHAPEFNKIKSEKKTYIIPKESTIYFGV